MGTKKSSKKESSTENDKTKKYKIKKEKKKGKHPKLKKAILIIFIILLLLIIAAVGVVAAVFMGYGGDDFTIEQSDLELQKLTTVVKDGEGNVIAKLSGEENRLIISRQDMPDYLPKAFVSIEDERFYQHHGVDILRTGRATISYVLHLGKGTASGGGSTITQQLVKNITDNGKDSSGLDGMLRKVREMAKATQVEKMISKDQILELYLNTIFLGDQAYGVEVASQYYFSKSAKDLDLAECAFLAGINNSPNLYRPFETDEEKIEKAQEKIRKRTLTVLAKMKELGAITEEEEYNNAVEEVNAGLKFVKGNITDNSNYSYHTAAAINQIKQQLMEEKGWSKELAEFNIYNNGYTIYTTQDSAIQARIEEEFIKDKHIVSGKEKNEDGTLKNNHTQAAMVIMDHTTGQVLGTAGGLGTDSTAIGVNRATQKRQTGSAMKPISVIAPGLENGIITAGTVYDDCPTDFGIGKGYNWPKNYYKVHKGLSTIRDVIAISQNVIPVKVITELGIEKAYNFVESVGIKLDERDKGPSLALGGLTYGASAVEMAGAYGAIANGGEYITPTFYTKVEDKNGKVVIEAKQEKKRVMSEQNAYIEKTILTQPVKSGGTATYCAISGMDVAAKTGTTNDDYDRWLCGFTPYYTATVWYGYDYNEELKNFSKNPAGEIWDNVMTDLHKNLEKKRFEQPSGIVQATICKDTGLLATEKCSNKYTEYFVKGTVPTEKCSGSTAVTICKETGKIANEYCKDTEEVYYKVKPPKEQNPKGWTSNHGDKFANPPTEVCDVHKKPVEVEKPVNNTVTNNTTVNNTTKPTNNTTGGNTTGNSTTGNTTTSNTTTGNTTKPTNNTTGGNTTGNTTTSKNNTVNR